ncbi:zinc ribbon domain-containing protein [Yersinia ruckeri]|uniref:zinc ribbon domain-containing protein n=1 Tax=Yersinia ruckeri TaxID=29486 RepID=UPI0011A29714|nr:zinc ribbon domain-containing protein [Yersinia ruckeri]EKN4688796.1 zinc ribbon domain-containing protein [Yersinia ruckeri]UIM96673.1 zinc ribbon domain-containing protein [Yersinia ruckeri]
MEAMCPVCHVPMNKVSGHFHCSVCHSDYQPQAICPDCGKPLQVLTACGAVDYFCQHGDGLISRKRVKFTQCAVKPRPSGWGYKARFST